MKTARSVLPIAWWAVAVLAFVAAAYGCIKLYRLTPTLNVDIPGASVEFEADQEVHAAKRRIISILLVSTPILILSTGIAIGSTLRAHSRNIDDGQDEIGSESCTEDATDDEHCGDPGS